MDWNLILSILSLVISSLLTVGIFYVGSKASKIDALESRLEEKAGEIIDARMQVLESRLTISIRSLENIVGTMRERLQAGDDHFKSVDQKCHALELKVMTQVMELTRELATKADMKELSRAISEMQLRLSRRPAPSEN